MKRFAFIVLVLACLVSCKTDLTDIENRITEVEKHGQTLDSKTKQLMDESKRLSDDIKELQKKSQAPDDAEADSLAVYQHRHQLHESGGAAVE